MTSSNHRSLGRHKLEECLHHLLYLYHVRPIQNLPLPASASAFAASANLHLRICTCICTDSPVETLQLGAPSKCRQACLKLDQTLKRTRPSATPQRPPEPALETPLQLPLGPALTLAVAQSAPRESHFLRRDLRWVFSRPGPKLQSQLSQVLDAEGRPSLASTAAADATGPRALTVSFGGSLRSCRGLEFHATRNLDIRSQRKTPEPPFRIHPRLLQPVRVSRRLGRPGALFITRRLPDSWLLLFLLPSAVVRRAKRAAIFFFLFYGRPSGPFLSIHCWLRSLFTLFIQPSFSSVSDF